MKKTTLLIVGILVIVLAIIIVLSQMDLADNTQSEIFEVNDDYDDGRTFTVENNELGYENENGGWAKNQLAKSYSFGVRFTNVSIPHGVKIKNAYVEVYSIGTPGHSTPNCKIYCDDVDDAVNFSVGVLDISGRKYTSAYSRWNETVPYAEWVKTPKLTALIQEIISRPNWAVGNSIAVLFVSEGLTGYSATFDNYENGYPAKLYVEWE